MKRLLEAVGAPVPMSVKAGKFLSWATVARLFNAIPLGVCECETIEDAKGYAKALALLLSALLAAGMEGGAI